MATAQKPDRGSLSRRDPSLVARVGAGAAAALDSVTSGGVSTRFEAPSKGLLNRVLLALGIRALVTGIALTVISPTIPVFVGVNLLFGVPVAVRYLYRRRTADRGRGLGGRSTTVSGRLSRAMRVLSDLSSSSDSNRL